MSLNEFSPRQAALYGGMLVSGMKQKKYRRTSFHNDSEIKVVLNVFEERKSVF